MYVEPAEHNFTIRMIYHVDHAPALGPAIAIIMNHAEYKIHVEDYHCFRDYSVRNTQAWVATKLEALNTLNEEDDERLMCFVRAEV